MPTNLTAIENALAGLTDIELYALIVATNEAPQTAPGLLAWIEGACDWEINRRVGRNYELPPPQAAIEGDAVSIEATYTMRASFAVGDLTPAALKFFDALVKSLTDGGKRKR